MKPESESACGELKNLTLRFDAAILYTPIKAKGEIDYGNPEFPIKIPERKILVPQSKESDPFEWAKKVKKEFVNKKISKKVFILIPGRKFDIYGTRHGNGGGWYDRFLSKVPREWLRIGVCDSSRFSEKQIERKEHDEPMDWIVIKSPEKLFCIRASKSLSSRS